MQKKISQIVNIDDNTYNLSELFYLETLNYLNEHHFFFKKLNYSSTVEYVLCKKEQNEQNLVNITLDFLKSNDNYYQSLNKHVTPHVIDYLLKNHETLFLTTFNELPILQSARYKKNILNSNNYYYLRNLFTTESFVYFLSHCKDDKLKNDSVHHFRELLTNIHREFNQHENYEHILLNLLEKNSALIKKTDGNLLNIQSWFYNNIGDLTAFNSYLNKDNKHINDILLKIPFKTYTKWINLTDLPTLLPVEQFRYIKEYTKMIQLMIKIFNHKHINQYIHLNINKVTGCSVPKKKVFQLTFYINEKKEHNICSKNLNNGIIQSMGKEISTDIEDKIEHYIFQILSTLQNYLSIKKTEQPELFNYVFKTISYQNLHEKINNQCTTSIKEIAIKI